VRIKEGGRRRNFFLNRLAMEPNRREGGKEGGREKGREGGREGGREVPSS